MSAQSKIEWTDASWTPIRALNPENGKIGWHCEHVTTGCAGCYAESMNKRLGTGLPFKPGHRKDVTIFLDEEMLIAPLRWKKPRMIFVCSMTDLFADFVQDEWIDKIFAVMALAPQHTFQVLTKRAERMRDYLNQLLNQARSVEINHRHIVPTGTQRLNADGVIGIVPLPNVWLGVSAERQQEADERIPLLLQTPAAVRFVSCEPLLGPIKLWGDNGEGLLRGPGVVVSGGTTASTPHESPEGYDDSHPGLDWVIVGGESGPDARPMAPEWAVSLRDQCSAAEVPYFFKQWGEYRPCTQAEMKTACGAVLVGQRERCGYYCDDRVGHVDHGGTYMLRVGKKSAGRQLDGRTHDEFPWVPA